MEIRELQEEIFSIFKLFDAYCRENGLRYYLLGGSMLGAVRHNGFIPWDDDMDVGMPRSDYKKLMFNIQKFLDEHAGNMFVQCTEINRNFSHDYIKIMKKITFHGKELEVFLDVFPLDGCPYKDKKHIKKYYKKLDILRWMKNSHYMSLQNKNVIKKAIVILLRLCPLSVYRKIMSHYLERNDFDTSVSVGDFSWVCEEAIMEKSIYGNPTLVQFEDGMYYGVQNADAYLTAMYGDYMTPTPVEQRETHLDI